MMSISKVILGILCLSASLTAARINVPENYPTIQSAIVASLAGDTVLVAPGVYVERLDFLGKRVKVVSSEGNAVTFLRSPSGDIFGEPLILFENSEPASTEFSGFTLDQGRAADLILVSNGANPRIRNNVFRNLIVDLRIIHVESAAPVIERNVFASNQVGNACLGITSGTVTIINNTFDSNSRGFYSLSANTIAKNNIVSNSSEYGVHGNFAILSYNDVWNNHPDYQFGPSPVNSISVDPQYMNSTGYDYRLLVSSPCIDAGDPAMEYQDPDGTRNDIGAIPLVLFYHGVENFAIDGSSFHHVTNHVPTFIWQYRDTTIEPQSRYQIEIGTDLDWTDAEVWSTGEVVSGEGTATYNGLELLDGSTYFGRIRVGNTSVWSNWYGFFISMNSLPTIPTTLTPAVADTVAASAVELLVNNSSDAESDPISYDFEVFSDSAAGLLVYSEYSVLSGPSVTRSRLITTLPPGQDYWWRTRSHDGREYSPWSAMVPFYVRSSKSLRVPSEFPTIQAAIDACSDLDTVLVAPGFYPGFIRLAAKNVVLISEAGPLVTVLQGPLLGNAREDPLIIFDGAAISRTEVRGFTLTGNSADFNVGIHGGASPVIQGNIFKGLSAGMSTIRCYGTNPLIIQNVFFDNAVGWACIGAETGTTRIINNTFYRNTRGFYSQTNRTIAINNIISNSAQYGVHGYFASLDYNCFWENHPSYDLVEPLGPHNMFANPRLVDPANGDFRLLQGSPCIDAGNPDPQFLDPDSSLNDVGALYYRRAMPIAGSVTVGSGHNLWVVENEPAIYWSFVDDPVFSPAGYHIEIGSDNNWDTAELWNTGEVIGTDLSVQYQGESLIDGQACTGRIRLFNGSYWGEWISFIFRLNSPPTAPVPLGPGDMQESPVAITRLLVRNSSDAQQDSLTYQFEVYADEEFTQLVASQPSVVGQSDSTFTMIIQNLEPLRFYWWRVRASDNREFSSWSATSSFFTRLPSVYAVPSQINTISYALVLAQDGDSVVVAPGMYIETLDFFRKHIVLTTFAGAEHTILRNTGILINSTPGLPAAISGFTMDGTSYISIIDGAQPVIQNNHFKNTINVYDFIIRSYNSHPIIRENLFVNNLTRYQCVIIYSGHSEIHDNTFFNNRGGILSETKLTRAFNNIVVNSTSSGLKGNFGPADYNLVYNCSPNFDVVEGLGAHNLSVDPMFISIDSAHFELYPESPGVDAGNPSPEYNDPDGSRNDIGAFPAADLTLEAFDLFLPTNTPEVALDNRTPTFVWNSTDDGYPYSTTSYSLYLANDSLFTFVNINDSLTENSFVLANPLAWGTRYWWKVRAQHQFNRERWSEQVFSFRTMTLGDPDGNARIDVSDIVFIVNFIFAHGPAPVPLIAGDINCDAKINIGDAVYLVNYVFLSGPPPCDGFTTMAPTIQFGPGDNSNYLESDSAPESQLR